MFGEEAVDDLKATLEMQRGKKLPKLGGYAPAISPGSLVSLAIASR
jgi:hypothetical protein